MSYIDLHAHVLPGVDDGAETLEASLMMLRMASEHGTKALAVTPHGAGGTSPPRPDDPASTSPWPPGRGPICASRGSRV